MALQFPKQLQEAGIKKPIIGGGTSYDEFVLPAMGDEVLGHVSALQYSAALDTPKNREFVRKYREKYGKVPPTTRVELHHRADDPRGDEAHERQVARAEKFIAMITQLKLDAVRGPVRFDDMRNPSRTSTSRRSRRRRCTATTRTSSGTR